jgi:CubicO group peptidase (beta-lactamase class C family)
MRRFRSEIVHDGLRIRCTAVFVAMVATAVLAADNDSRPVEAAQKESRRRFQDQELTVASPFAYLLNPNQAPPRIIWRDVDEVRRLGGDGTLRVRWFDADLNESSRPNRPGRWSAYVEGVAPNGSPVRRAMTFYCRPPGFLLYFPPADPLAPPHQPGPIDPAVWAEHRDELAAAAAQAWFQSLNSTEAGAILIAGLSEAAPLGRAPTEIESAAVRNEAYHLRLKLKVQGLADTVRDLAPPSPAARPAPVLRAGDASEAGVHSGATAAIDAVCEAWARDAGEPFVTLVARRGVIVSHRAFDRVAGGAPVGLDYRCPVFSITKTLTAVAFARFVDQRVYDFDDSIAAAFPDYRHDPARVPTFRQCLTHMSGLSGHGDWGGSTNTYFENIVLNGIDANVAGSVYEYSGAGFDLAAKAMEITTGKTWRHVYHDHLFAPLGLGDIPMDNASSGARLTAYELGTLAQLLCNRGTYGDRQLFAPATFDRLLPEPLGRRYRGVDVEEGIGVHWMNVTLPGPADGACGAPEKLLGPRTIGHGSLSGCTLLVDLDRDLIIVQVRRQAGPRYGQWFPRFVAAVVQALRE